jgi:hypothetical protein
MGGWLDPRACLDDVEKRKLLTLPGLELRPLGRPARCQFLYRLRYPGSFLLGSSHFNLSGESSFDSDSNMILSIVYIKKPALKKHIKPELLLMPTILVWHFLYTECLTIRVSAS